MGREEANDDRRIFERVSKLKFYCYKAVSHLSCRGTRDLCTEFINGLYDELDW